MGEIEVDNLNGAMDVSFIYLGLPVIAAHTRVVMARQPVRDDSNVIETWPYLLRAVRTDERHVRPNAIPSPVECHRKLRPIKRAV